MTEPSGETPPAAEAELDEAALKEKEANDALEVYPAATTFIINHPNTRFLGSDVGTGETKETTRQKSHQKRCSSRL